MRPVLVGTCLVALLAARDARACGGFFCDSPTPVDQTAEQIIFAEEGGKAATYVQIKFTGRAADFGWIVPVTQVPDDVATSDIAIFNELQQITAPQFLAPPGDPPSGCSGVGCGSADVAATSRAGGALPPEDVDVLKEGTVGPYEFVVLKSESADELLKWLSDRKYVVSADAKAVVQQYLDEKAMFVALKLVPDADVTNLAPVKFTFPKFEPCVPLRLTRVSAQPDMGVLVYVLGDARATPVKYGHVEVDMTKVRFQFSQLGNTNYRTLLGQAIDAAGGRAFTTEFAGRASTVLPQATGEATRKLLMNAHYVTRLYSVLSPDEMTADPEFAFDTEGKLPDVSNVHQLGEDSLQGAGLPVFAIPLLAAALMRRRRVRA